VLTERGDEATTIKLPVGRPVPGENSVRYPVVILYAVEATAVGGEDYL
jgi:hypothetical protein